LLVESSKDKNARHKPTKRPGANGRAEGAVAEAPQAKGHATRNDN